MRSAGRPPDRHFGNLDAERAIERDRGIHVARDEVDHEQIGRLHRIAPRRAARRRLCIPMRLLMNTSLPGWRITRWCHTPRGTIVASPALSAIVLRVPS